MDNEYIRILAANIGPIIANELAPMKQELRAIADSTHNLHLKLGALQTRFDEISERQETLGYQLLGLTKSQSELIHKKQKANGVVLENLVSSVNCLPTTISVSIILVRNSTDCIKFYLICGYSSRLMALILFLFFSIKKIISGVFMGEV